MAAVSAISTFSPTPALVAIQSLWEKPAWGEKSDKEKIACEKKMMALFMQGYGCFNIQDVSKLNQIAQGLPNNSPLLGKITELTNQLSTHSKKGFSFVEEVPEEVWGRIWKWLPLDLVFQYTVLSKKLKDSIHRQLAERLAKYIEESKTTIPRALLIRLLTICGKQVESLDLAILCDPKEDVNSSCGKIMQLLDLCPNLQKFTLHQPWMLIPSLLKNRTTIRQLTFIVRMEEAINASGQITMRYPSLSLNCISVCANEEEAFEKLLQLGLRFSDLAERSSKERHEALSSEMVSLAELGFDFVRFFGVAPTERSEIFRKVKENYGAYKRLYDYGVTLPELLALSEEEQERIVKDIALTMEMFDYDDL